MQNARTTLLNNHYIVKILNIGEIFKNVKTGDITIIITISKKLYRNIPKCLYYDLTCLPSCKYYKKTLRQNVYTITKDGWELIKNTKPTEITIDYNNYVILSDDRQTTIAENQLRRIILDTKTKSLQTEINNLFTEWKQNDKPLDLTTIIKQCEDIKEEVNSMKFKQVKLNELFVFVNKCNGVGENIPKYGATQNNEPVGYLNTYNYCVPNDEDLNNYVWFVTTGDGAAGYCHKLKHRCVNLQSSFLTKTNTPITDENIMLISLQLHQVFNHSNTLSKQRFNNTFVYIVC